MHHDQIIIKLWNPINKQIIKLTQHNYKGNNLITSSYSYTNPIKNQPFVLQVLYEWKNISTNKPPKLYVPIVIKVPICDLH